jgi:RNA polymerase sigma-70 factor (ECF subfamily)
MKFNIKKVIKGCLKGQLNSQRKLYEHFYGYGMSITLRYCKNREEAVEVLNDAFLKVFKSLSKYNPDYPFQVWFRKILLNCTIDYHRKYHKFPILMDIEDYSDLHSEEMALPNFSLNEDVLPIIQQLSPAYRMVFNLYVMEEYSHKEIAKILNITVGTSKSNLMRAKRNLRNLLTDEQIKNKKIN